MQDQMLPDGYCFLLRSFTRHCQKLAKDKVRCHDALFAAPKQEKRFVNIRSPAMKCATNVLDRAMQRIKGKLLPKMVARDGQ